MCGIFDDFLQKEEPFPFGIVTGIGLGRIGTQSVGYAMQVMPAIEYILVRNDAPEDGEIRIIECRVQAALDFCVTTAADRN